jgi:hypothetical protein
MPTNDFMDKFVAPGYSSFTAATIPDLSAVNPEQGHWLTNFIPSGSGLRGVSLDDRTRRTLFNFLRRTEAAFREYEAAREFTLAHLAKPNHKEYVKAIDRWETTINSGQLPPDGTIPVWLTNDGLQAVDGKLTFAEIAEILVDLAKWADAARDPLTMRETIRASYGLSEDKEDS